MIQDTYQIIREIGSGSGGTVLRLLFVAKTVFSSFRFEISCVISSKLQNEQTRRSRVPGRTFGSLFMGLCEQRSAWMFEEPNVSGIDVI